MFVFGIVFHKITNPLKYTIAKLSKSKRNIIILLLDKKASDSVYSEIKEFTRDFKNVIFAPRISVDWARFTLTLAPLSLMKIACNYEFKYFSLISGDDIPIMSNDEMNKFLDISYKNQSEFIGYTPDVHKKRSLVNPYWRLQIDFPNLFFTREKGYLVKLKKVCVYLYLFVFKRKNLDQIPPLYKGCNWFTISNHAISYIFSYLQNNSRYAETFENSYCSDEMFFQTILFNSEFKKHIFGIDKKIPDCEMALRNIDWETGPEYPKIFKEEDFYRLKKSNLLFARKIESDISIDTLIEYFG